MADDTGDAVRAWDKAKTRRPDQQETDGAEDGDLVVFDFADKPGLAGDALRDEVGRWRDDALRLRERAARIEDEVCQTLGKALGFPWYKDDQENFPGAALRHGVCVSDHVAESLAVEAAREIERLRAEVERLRAWMRDAAQALSCIDNAECRRVADDLIVRAAEGEGEGR